MFKKLFGNKKQPHKQLHPDPRLDALKNAIENQRKTDNLVGAKLYGKEFYERTTNFLQEADPRGIHVETLLVIIGALGGFSAQMAIREGLVKTGKITERQAFVTAQGIDGKNYVFGDTLNGALFEGKACFFSFAAGKIHSEGVKLPDMHELAKHVASSIGKDTFGIPRFPEGHNAADNPYTFVKMMWAKELNNLLFYCASPIEWPIAFGIAAQHAIELAKAQISPELAIQIVMEAAFPMSKLDYRDIVNAA